MKEKAINFINKAKHIKNKAKKVVDKTIKAVININYKKIGENLNFYREETFYVLGCVFFVTACFSINKTLGLFSISAMFFISIYMSILRDKYLTK